MSLLNNLISKASQLSIFDKQPTEKRLSKDELFCNEYHISQGETIVDECAAELAIENSFNKNLPEVPLESNLSQLRFLSGKVYLSQHFLIFRDTYDRQSGCLKLHLSMVKQLKRLPSRNYLFLLSILTYNDLRITIQFVGIRSHCEQFSYNLKTCLTKNLKATPELVPFLETLYSEFLLSKNGSSRMDIVTPPPGGLGLIFKFPGDPVKLQNRIKTKAWWNYLKRNGRNLCINSDKSFLRLINVGLPNRLRGEIWELSCGSIYDRYMNSHEYTDLLAKNQGKSSIAIDEIEKDLYRSLPEYNAYQNPEGINRLRRVLTAYSWKNPEIGYCQAMNIVVAAMLIYMSEDQAYWCLDKLCGQIIPGYYSKTMYGVLLDQKVFESLVEKTLPMMHQHFNKHDIQLSIVSLPWFMSLFLNTMPLIYAFRIMDIFFLNGPKTLLQVALAVVKINGEKLWECEDDGECIAVFKDFFHSLDEHVPDIHYKNKTRFQELLVVAFREFSHISDETFVQYRTKNRNEVISGIESYLKKAQLRKLPKTPNLKEEHLSNVYDRYVSVLNNNYVEVGSDSSVMNFKMFAKFMDGLVDWINLEEKENIAQQKSFLIKLFKNWRSDEETGLTLENIAVGMNKLMEHDLMTSISNFFEIYDVNGTGKVDRDGILQISEDLIFLTTPWRDGYLFDEITNKAIESKIAEKIVEKRKNFDSSDEISIPSEMNFDKEKWVHEQSQRYLSLTSNFLHRAFEYALPEEENVDLIELEESEGSEKKSVIANPALNPSAPVYLNLPTFRMVVLADETSELFFTRTFKQSIHLDQKVEKGSTNVRDLFNNILADGRRVAVEVRRRINSDHTSRSSEKSQGSNTGAYNEEDDDFTANDNNEDNDYLLNNAEANVLNDSIPVEKGDKAFLQHVDHQIGSDQEGEKVIDF
ncbi:hypothetical protein LJB42_002481 [Komagataella kurtzmanii]|nr:hypothetical protein LJB42_002481 [Komagataella kurtzmanii]